MAGPGAEFTITATDNTDAAFRSAQAHLDRLKAGTEKFQAGFGRATALIAAGKVNYRAPIFMTQHIKCAPSAENSMQLKLNAGSSSIADVKHGSIPHHTHINDISDVNGYSYCLVV